MSELDDRVRRLSSAKRALLALRLREPAPSAGVPVAVVGLGCRFPGGANDPERFWKLLESGSDAVREVPAHRWDLERWFDPDPDAPGRMSTRCGGFLDGEIDRFDAGFFGISPREASRMDPQQRLLLEVAWEALEDAGATTSRLAGSATGVYVGMCAADYAWLQFADARAIDSYTGTGTAYSVASGRLSYLFDLHGPSLAVDTACSSSLLAVHLACRALRGGECDLALAGGVHLMVTPLFNVATSKMRMMSPSGRCRAFDAAADGIVQGEGSGVVVLKRLPDAIADGDHVRAVVLGTAANQDGASAGMTAPSGPAQEAAIRAALADAGLEPSRIDYVEAHGTGTTLGDPIEIEALFEVFGRDRPAGRPLVVGSVKTNLGHLSAAAGISGLVKSILALERETIPPHLHFRELNPRISVDRSWLAIPTRPVPWPSRGGARALGVSSFGWSGTNVHLVVGEPPPQPGPATAEPRAASLLVVSARSEAALRELGRAWRALAESPISLEDACRAASRRRSHHDHRLAIAFRGREELAERLDGYLLRDERPAGLSTGRKGVRAPRVVFVFPGQGSQWPGMGRALLEAEPAFRAAFDDCARAFAAATSGSLHEVLASSALDRVDLVQPALFAIEFALAALWRSWGVEPDAVAGHSMGEVAAAAVAGHLSLEDATRVICRRSRLLARVAGRGTMAFVEASLEEAKGAIAGSSGRISVAASNGPRATVLSGDPEAIEALADEFRRQGRFCRPVKVDVASHSHYMDPLAGDLLAALAEVRPRPGTIPFYSTALGRWAEGSELGAAYWVRNLREPVLFAGAVEALLAEGHDAFLELSPHPILVPAVEDVARHAGRSALATGSLRREEAGPAVLREALGRLYAAGLDPDWKAVHPGPAHKVPLPLYPWQRERHWLEAPRRRARDDEPSVHPLLGRPVPTPLPATIHEAAFSRETLPFLEDHRLHGHVVVPGVAYLEMALAAGSGEGTEVRDLVIERALVLADDEERTVQFVLSPGGAFEVHSLEGGSTWRRHARGTLGSVERPRGRAVSLEEIRERCPVEVAPADLYARTAELGYRFGPAFQGPREIRRGASEALSRVELDPGRVRDAGRYRLHPAFFDSCLHVLMVCPRPGATGPAFDDLFSPVGLDRFVYYGPRSTRLFAHGAIRPEEGDAEETLTGDVRLYDEAGALVAEIEGLRLKRATPEAIRRAARGRTSDLLYEVEWVEIPRIPPAEATGRYRVAGDLLGVGAELARLLPSDPETPLSGAVHFVARGPEGLLEVVEIARALAREGARDPARLFLVTRGARAVGPEPAIAFDRSTPWGLLRVLAHEHPELAATAIDLDPAGEPDEARRLLEEILSPDGEDAVARRGGTRFGERLVRSPRAASPAGPLRIRPEAAYLVTGGTGGLGLALARRLVERGARRLILAARRDPSPETRAAIRELEAAGASVLVARADVARRQDVARLLALAPELAGIFHAAGVLDDGMLLSLDEPRIRSVLEPKVGGAWNLHALTLGMPLDHFVLYSSVATLLGSPGQANYAAANAYLDALAHHRRSLGLPALSIAWGPWAEVGLAAARDDRGERLAARGLGSLSPAEALDALEVLFASPRAHVAVMPFSPGPWRRFHPGATRGPYWSALAEEEPAGPPVDGGLARRLAELPTLAERRALFERHVRELVGRTLRIPPARVPADEPLAKGLGLDSLLAMELRNRLEASLDLSLSSTLVWNHPTLQALTEHLAARLGLGSREDPAPPPPADDAVLRTTLEGLSDSEAEALLAERLAGLEGEGTP